MKPPALSDWIVTLPVCEAIVRASESAWYGEIHFSPPLLDVGCGDGGFGARAYPIEVTVGMDIDEANVRAARGNKRYRHCIVADARRLPFMRGAFRSAASNCVLEHVPGVEEGMAEIARVLRTDGLFALTVPSEKCGGLDRIRKGRRVSFFESAVNRLWNHVNLHDSSWWIRPSEKWTLMDRRYYLGPAAYRACLLFFWLGGPWAFLVRAVTGRKVLFEGLRKLWAPLVASMIGRDHADESTGVSFALLLKRREEPS